MLARDHQRRLFDRPDHLGARQRVVDDLAAEVGRAENHRAAAEHAGRDRALERGGIGGVGHPRRLDRGRQAVLGDRDQAEVEEEALLFARRAAGRGDEEEFGEGRPAHEVAGEVAPAYADALGRRRGDGGPRGPRLADQHARSLLFRASPPLSDAVADRVRRSTSAATTPWPDRFSAVADCYMTVQQL